MQKLNTMFINWPNWHWMSMKSSQTVNKLTCKERKLWRHVLIEQSTKNKLETRHEYRHKLRNRNGIQTMSSMILACVCSTTMMTTYTEGGAICSVIQTTCYQERVQLNWVEQVLCGGKMLYEYFIKVQRQEKKTGSGAKHSLKMQSLSWGQCWKKSLWRK